MLNFVSTKSLEAHAYFIVVVILEWPSNYQTRSEVTEHDRSGRVLDTRSRDSRVNLPV